MAYFILTLPKCLVVFPPLSAKPEAERKRADVLSREIKERWSAMSDEEKAEVTKDAVEKLLARREMKETAIINSQIHAFADARSELAHIKKRLADLNARTGVQSVLVAVRGDIEDILSPQIFSTGDQINLLFQKLYKDSVANFAAQLEGYMLSGIADTMARAPRSIVDLKKQAKDLIITSLAEAYGAAKPPKLNFVKFEEKFTDVYGIICEGWPLPIFQAPGDVRSKSDLLKLIDAFENGSAKFRRLTRVE
ncbi:hypothetical protein K474DRAFT_1587929, partial [Panus rudis PR-1116 ss-1]